MDVGTGSVVYVVNSSVFQIEIFSIIKYIELIKDDVFETNNRTIIYVDILFTIADL